MACKKCVDCDDVVKGNVVWVRRWVAVAGGVEVHAIRVYVSNVHDGWGWNDVEGRDAYAMCCEE